MYYAARVVIHLREGRLQQISDTHRSSDALHFVLIHPLDHDQLKQVNPQILDDEGNPIQTNNQITAREFYAFHIHKRPSSANSLLRMCRLFQEYFCVQGVKYENQKLY